MGEPDTTVWQEVARDNWALEARDITDDPQEARRLAAYLYWQQTRAVPPDGDREP